MADMAQNVANESSTIEEFDEGFSYLYHGPRIQGYSSARVSQNGNEGTINPYYRSNGSGFQERYRDTGTEPDPIGGRYADQTHHFSFYLSVGINGQRAIYLQVKLVCARGSPSRVLIMQEISVWVLRHTLTANTCGDILGRLDTSETGFGKIYAPARDMGSITQNRHDYEDDS